MGVCPVHLGPLDFARNCCRHRVLAPGPKFSPGHSVFGGLGDMLTFVVSRKMHGILKVNRKNISFKQELVV